MDSWGDFKCKLECSVWWLYYLRHSSSWNNMALLSQYPKCFQKLLFNLIFQHPTQTPSRLDHLSLQNSLPSCFCFSSLLHFWHCSGGLTKCTIAAKSPRLARLAHIAQSGPNNTLLHLFDAFEKKRSSQWSTWGWPGEMKTFWGVMSLSLSLYMDLKRKRIGVWPT